MTDGQQWLRDKVVKMKERVSQLEAHLPFLLCEASKMHEFHFNDSVIMTQNSRKTGKIKLNLEIIIFTDPD